MRKIVHGRAAEVPREDIGRDWLTRQVWAEVAPRRAKAPARLPRPVAVGKTKKVATEAVAVGFSPFGRDGNVGLSPTDMDSPDGLSPAHWEAHMRPLTAPKVRIGKPAAAARIRGMVADHAAHAARLAAAAKIAVSRSWQSGVDFDDDDAAHFTETLANLAADLET